MHVEVTVERVKRRFGVEIVTHPPRVPYFEAIRRKARAHARYKKQTGGRGQFGDCHIEVEPLPAHEGYEFIDKIVGGVIPQGFRPGGRQGHPGDDARRRSGGLSGHRRAGHARRRLLPLRRLLGDGVQDRGLDGLQEGLL